jgi:hypothetical protein
VGGKLKTVKRVNGKKVKMDDPTHFKESSLHKEWRCGTMQLSFEQFKANKEAERIISEF